MKFLTKNSLFLLLACLVPFTASGGQGWFSGSNSKKVAGYAVAALAVGAASYGLWKYWTKPVQVQPGQHVLDDADQQMLDEALEQFEDEQSWDRVLQLADVPQDNEVLEDNDEALALEEGGQVQEPRLQPVRGGAAMSGMEAAHGGQSGEQNSDEQEEEQEFVEEGFGLGLMAVQVPQGSQLPETTFDLEEDASQYQRADSRDPRYVERVREGKHAVQENQGWAKVDYSEAVDAWLKKQGLADFNTFKQQVQALVGAFLYKPAFQVNNVYNMGLKSKAATYLVENYELLLGKIAGCEKSLAAAQQDVSTRTWKDELRELRVMLQEAYKQGPWETGRRILQQGYEGMTATEAASCVAWYLTERAVEKDQAFTEGTFVIEDPITHRGIGFVQSILHAAIWEQKAERGTEEVDQGERISSHFKKVKPQFGLDIHTGATLFGLPNGHQTLLFGRGAYNDSSKLFIKPESHGVEGAMAFVSHGFSFLESRVRKLMPGADDKPQWRKEHPPADVLKAWLTMFYATPFYKAFYAQLGYVQWVAWRGWHPEIERAKKDGISAMLEIGERYFSEAQLIEFNHLLENYDHLRIRKGREVILSQRELRP